MRILYLNTTYSGGGAEKVTRQIYDGMKKRGHDVYEIVCYNRRGTVEDEHVHVLYNGTVGKILMRLQTANRANEDLTISYAINYIEQFVKKYKIDLIHLNNPHDSFLGIRDIGKLTEWCPVVWTLHDFWALTGHCAFPFGCDDRWKTGCTACEHLENYPRLRRDVCKKLFEYKQQYLCGKGIHFTVPSEWMKDQVKESYLKNEKCTVIYNSLNIDQWKPLDKQITREKYDCVTEKFVLAFVAADMKIPQKGMNYLKEVLEQLDPEKYMLLIAGKCSDELNEVSKKFEIRNFGYIKEQEKMNEFFSMADVLLNPSVYETFGLVNIEAMASGTPVVAFDICVMPEVIGIEGGWIVKELSADALCSCLESLEKDRAEVEEKAETCVECVREYYDEEEMLDAFDRLYETIKKERQNGR